MPIHPALPALFAALLFGASTPLAKYLLGQMPAFLLAGLLYLGSGLGLALLMGVRGGVRRARGQGPVALQIPRTDWPWLAGATVFGGMLGPLCLMLGLTQTAAASASLLLNLEGVFTALLAWWVFKENADRGVVAGMTCIVVGGVMLAWAPGEMANIMAGDIAGDIAQGAGVAFNAGVTSFSGALLIVLACACWAIDNNLTRKVSAQDAMLIACIKGLVAGVCTTGLYALAGWLGRAPVVWPSLPILGRSLVLGFVGYGLSLSLFVVALRTLGTARTGAYFSVAPLVGVLISWVIWPQWPDPAFWPAAALMALGVWLHAREQHVHAHQHLPLAHQHTHRHDAHHQHQHAFAWDGHEPHVHPHEHAAIEHAHAHYPDIHHRHPHPH